MERAVQPRHLVVQQVPQIILEVKDHHAAQDAQEKATECGRLTWQWSGRPPQPLRHCGREDVTYVVVDCDTQGGPDVRPGDGSVRVEPVAVDAGPSGSQEVQDGVHTNQEEVGGDGEDDGERGAPQKVVVVLVEVVPEGLQDQA